MKQNLKLFLAFLKIGAITFGGGYAMISMIKSEIVDKRKWLTEDELIELTVIAESSPGPIAINAATYVGYKVNKFLGALASTIAVVIPSLIIITIVAYFFDMFLENIYIAYAFMGIKAAVAYLILDAGIKLFKKMEKKPLPIILFFISIILLFVFEIFNINASSIIFILASGIIGIIASIISIRKNKNKEEII